jgi:hypothetical protein
MDFGMIAWVVLFIAWGLLCFWFGRRPQQVKDTIHTIEEKISGITHKDVKGAPLLNSYADVYDLMAAVGATGYAGEVRVDNKIVRSGTTPGVSYVTGPSGVSVAVPATPPAP